MRLLQLSVRGRSHIFKQHKSGPRSQGFGASAPAQQPLYRAALYLWSLTRFQQVSSEGSVQTPKFVASDI